MPDPHLRDRLQAALGANYAIGRELEGGGMSRVFVADDAALSRQVVVKVLPADAAAGVSVERFRREIMLAARLQHPHIVPVLNAAEVDGLPYFTMPFVEGESLRTRLNRGGELPVADGVRVLREVAAALDYAHEKGIVHRDIKPDNVLLSRGSAMVTDFGVAKALSAAADEEVAGVTSVGVALGTPAYMSPEQASASPNIDTRADIYAFGVLAYELFAGRPPFTGRSTQALLAAHITDAPVPIERLRPALPSTLAALIMRCLEKNPADRPQSAVDVMRALDAITTSSGALPPPRGGNLTSRSPLLGVALATVIVAIAAVAMFRRDAGVPIGRPRLIVLPFENLGAATDAYFAAGLGEEITTRLSGVAALEVVGRTTAQQYQNTKKTATELARELGVTHVLTGTVRWEKIADGSSRVRVSPQLVRATDQTAIWAEPFEGPLSDVFAFQSRVAERVAQALDVALRPPDQQRLIRRPTNNLDAYDAYLRGLASSTRAKVFQAPARREAVKEFERAVQLDPAFTAAHARLAIALTNRVFHDGDVALSVVRPSVDRAMALDSTLLETRLARATYLQLVDAQAALSVATQAVADQPNSVELLVQLGLAQWSVFREAEAAKTLERAAELDPRSPDPLAYLAGLFDQLGRYEEAMRWREREITLTPDNPAAYVSQASADMLWRVDTASARRQLERGIAAAGLKAMTLRRGRAVMGALKKRTLPRELVICNDTVSLSGSGMPPLLFHVEKAIYLANAGQIDRARVHAASAVALTPMTSDDPQVHANLAMMFAILGRASDEAGAAARAVELSDGTAASRRIIGMPYATVAAADMIVGRKDAALQRLEKALSYRSGFIISPALLRADPLWAPLRGNPRFERLINVR